MSKIAPSASSSELQISAPNRERDSPELIDLLCKTYSAGPGYWNAERAVRKGYLVNSNYDWAASRIGRWGNEIVTHFGVWNFQMRVGHARVRVAGIGAVATHDHYRKRGLLRQTANDALAALSGSDYAISLLFGIPNFYEQFGYRRAWTWLNVTIETDQILAKTIPGRLERSRSAVREDLATLYNRENADLTGTVVRPAFPSGNPFAESDVYLWKQGRTVKGFVFVGGTETTLDVRSWAGDPETILAVTKRLAAARRVRTVQFRWVHYQSQLSQFLRRQNCTFKSDYRASGGPMVRMLSLQRFAMRLRPELEDRLKRSHYCSWQGDLRIDDGQEAVTLRVSNGRIEVARAKPGRNSISGTESIVQLMLGTDDPEETIAAGRIRLRGEAKNLAPVLFPNEHPAISHWDRF
jgi:predicted N-acetyltransferase YhbS